MNRYHFIRSSGLPEDVLDKHELDKLNSDGVIVETWSMEGLDQDGAYIHISELAKDVKEDSRRVAQEQISQLSELILESTGRPVKESFQYNGVNSWWFLEIIFHEPAYLIRRREAVLEMIGKSSDHMMRLKGVTKSNSYFLPQMPGFEPSQTLSARLKHGISKGKKLLPLLYVEFKASLKELLQNQLYRRMLNKLKQNDVLFVFEYENLRRHKNSDGSTFTVLPYAEGVAERISANKSFESTILAKHLYPNEYESWGFVEGVTPRPIVKELPGILKAPLAELYEHSKMMLSGYYSYNDLENILAYKIAEFECYNDVLDKIKPKILFTYNWEGVFRPLIAAAKIKGCKVVGMQQALGPYLHALDHKMVGYDGEENGFPIPDKFLLWGNTHWKKMISYGYSEDHLLVTGYPRLDRHHNIQSGVESKRAEYCKMLGLDPDKRYLIFTGQHRVLDTALILRDKYQATLNSLVELSLEYDFYIIIKPWSGDDMSYISSFCENEVSGRVFVAPQDVVLHNADLLSICDWCIGTFSSFLGEAILSGVASLMLDYPEARYYFGSHHQVIYEGLLPFVNTPDDLKEALIPLLESQEKCMQLIESGRPVLENLFGPCDGKAAERVVNVIRDQLC